MSLNMTETILRSLALLSPRTREASRVVFKFQSESQPLGFRIFANLLSIILKLSGGLTYLMGTHLFMFSAFPALDQIRVTTFLLLLGDFFFLFTFLADQEV